MAKKNQEFMNSNDFKELTDAERKERFKEILEESEELDSNQDINISTQGEEEEEGYDPKEEELDPEDIDGDDEEDDTNFE